MPRVHVTTGLPASGKTTRAMELLADAKGSIRRVNLDSIRAMLDGPAAHDVWSHRHEGVAQEMQTAAVRACLAQGFDVIVDNTNLGARSLAPLKAVFSEFDDLTFAVHDFTDVPVEECIRRDAERENPVGEEAIQRLAKRHAGATKGGWKLTPAWLADRFVPTPYVADPSLPRAVLVDIDGTLALKGNRGVYDFEHCGRDHLNIPVARTVRLHRNAGDRIILLSGRGAEYRPQTLAWLADHEVWFDELHMRPENDQRRDDIVKAELFDAHVRDRFNVRMSLDDRTRVVNLWRRMGLPCWQVAPGDF
jgi:predicted kinase